MEKKINILVAEDEGIIAKDIIQTLVQLGYNVLDSVRTGKDVIEKAGELKPDLILMDIMLDDDISGIEATEIIQSTLNIPVIYLTALADEETLNKAKITEPFGYILKPFDERSLNSTISMALYKYEISSKLRERTIELEEEKKKSDNLLHNILPVEIVKELKENGLIAPREYKMVTLLFTDFEGFTSLSTQMPPDVLVNELNDIFKNFDEIIDRYNLEKLKTIGDSYVAAGGLPKENETHAINLVSAAIAMNEFLNQRNLNSKFQWKMRTGIHSGNVVAGVIGRNKYTYDVWGNTVNVASKMERFCQPGRINISSSTYNLVKDHFECEYHSDAEGLNNQIMPMYFVNSKIRDMATINKLS
jgi:class 3 adenylate cyclase